MYDYIIIGSGFGGSVSAMRLSEKGYKCLVIEKGKRFRPEDFPKSDWNVKKYLWMPALRFFGIMKLTFFKEVFVISGTGVGGGSLVYANTHMIPPDAFFQGAWTKGKDWKSVLMPFYEKAKFMLGTIPYTKFRTEDEILKEVARDMGKEESFKGVNVGVYYGDIKKPIDPYFNGLGPLRTGCQDCAACMVGCRHNAKNTLDKNYLYFAEKFGTEVMAETLATQIEYKDGIYHVHTTSSTAFPWAKKKQVIQAKGLIVSGGVLGSMELLLRQKYELGTMPLLSDRLGENLRTNSESISGLTLAKNIKLNHGVAITSTFNPDENTHIEIVKYNNESGLITKLATFATDGYSSFARTTQLLGKIIRNPFQFLKIALRPRWGSDSLVMLVMQSLDNALKMEWKKGILGGKLGFAKGSANVPVYIPVGQEVLYRYAEKVGGVPLNSAAESLFNMSTTAHILGGCPMGENADEGVVNAQFAVHNYPNMYILDGSIIPGNLGVNPSLSITALSEYAMSHIPAKENNTQLSLEELMHKQSNG